MSLVAAGLTGGVIAAVIAFFTVRAQNRKAHAEAFKAETEADAIIIGNLRGEVTRLTEQVETLRGNLDTIGVALEQCRVDSEAMKARIAELERIVSNHHKPAKRGNGRTD